MATTKIMGQNFRIHVGTVPVLEATSCQVTIQGTLQDASTKDDIGSYNLEQMTSKQWSVQVDGVDASLVNLRLLIGHFNSDVKNIVGWDQMTGNSNHEFQNADFARTGYAILNDLQIVANNRATTTVTCQYLGSGALF